MSEEWRVIEEFPEFSVSNMGRVKQNADGKIMSCFKNKSGYSYFRPPALKLHRLVARFHPNPDDKPFVDHIDRNPSNNCASNLRWATNSENRRNVNCQKNNKLGVKNVRFFRHVKPNGKVYEYYKHAITVNGKRISRYFHTLEEAVAYSQKIDEELTHS